VTVSKELTRLEHSAVTLTLTVPKDEVCAVYDKMLGEYVKSIQLPGFRKGRVPKELLERKLGESLREEALSRIIEEATHTVFEDNEFPRENLPLPYCPPRIDRKPVFSAEADIIFTMVYDVMPILKLGQWKGIEVTVPDVSIGDEEISRELGVIQERNALVSDKDDDAAAEDGDVVAINYAELTDSGAVIPETERQDFVFTLGSGYNLFKLDEDIRGMKKTESKDIEKSYPQDFEIRELAGQTKKIRVTLTGIKEKRLPELNDDFAQDVDDKYHTLEDLKTSIRQRLTKDLEERLQTLKINKIIEIIMERSPVDLPESMIEFQFESRLRNLAQRLRVSLDHLKESLKEPDGDLAKATGSWRNETITSIHSRLVLEAVMGELNLTVSEEEAAEHIEKYAQNSGTPVEEIRSYYEREGMREYLEDEIKEQKAYKQLLAENTVKLGDKQRYLEFIGNNG